MTAVGVAAGAVFAAMVASELALGRTKLQTGLARVVAVWAALYVAAIVWLARHGGDGLVAVTIFWSGTFLTWFGLRSHLESSILLRMLVLLRRHPMTDSELINRYVAEYGESKRVDELCRGGLVVVSGNRVEPTAKGRMVLHVVAKLR